jgi:hypothetical protein
MSKTILKTSTIVALIAVGIFASVWANTKIYTLAATEVSATAKEALDTFPAVCPTGEDAQAKAYSGRVVVSGATCYVTGAHDDTVLLSCHGTDDGKAALTKLGCTVKAYDAVKAETTSKDKAEADTAKAVMRGSTCAGLATVTWRKKAREYRVWPCRWQTDSKPGFRLVRLDAVGPGVIKHRRQLPRPVEQDAGVDAAVDAGKTEPREVIR